MQISDRIEAEDSMELKESWDDDWPEDDYPDEYDDDQSLTVECSECGEEVYEDAEQCPSCGNYIIHSSSGYVWKNRPSWWIALGLLGIMAVILAMSVLSL